VLPGVSGTCNVQVLRSVCNWSIGCGLEKTIQAAYIEEIANAQVAHVFSLHGKIHFSL